MQGIACGIVQWVWAMCSALPVGGGLSRQLAVKAPEGESNAGSNRAPSSAAFSASMRDRLGWLSALSACRGGQR